MPKRYNQDKIINDRGPNIIDICISTRLRILNGRKPGSIVNKLHCNCSSVTNVNSLKCMSWNIQGLDDTVIEDAYFNKCLEENDIVILLETWLDKHINLRDDKFYTFHHLGPMHARDIRPSGGICILIKKTLRSRGSITISKIVKESNYSLVQIIQGCTVHTARFIYMCSLHPSTKLNLL